MAFPLKIVFVCAGNVCRSPMAELEATPWSYAEPRLRLVIGGAYRVLKDFRSRPMSEEIVRDADLVLAMDKRHIREIVSRFPEARGKVATLTGYVGEEGEIVDFIDSQQGSFLEWLKSCDTKVDRCLERLVEKVSRQDFSA